MNKNENNDQPNGLLGKKHPLKRLKKTTDKKYKKHGDPACPQTKGGKQMSASQQYKKVHGCLCNDHGIWTVRARVIDPNTGKTRTRSKTTTYPVAGNNKRRAQEKMAEIVKQWEREINLGIRPDYNPRFSECIEDWLETKKLSLKPTTLRGYEMSAHVHIIPKLGDIRIADLTRGHLTAYFDSLAGMSVNTMKKHRVIIRGVLEEAVWDGIIPTNVADRVKLPKPQPFEGKALTEEEVGELLRKAETVPEPMRAAVTLAVIYGLRRSEICGLRWQDIDFEAGVMHIRNTVTEFGSMILEEERTKTKTSRRDIWLVDETVSYLRELQKQHVEKGFDLDKVCRLKDGSAVRPKYLTRMVMGFLADCGMKVRLHDLRHTAATMLARRLTIKQVQNFMGHSDIATTLNIYTHIDDADRISTSQTMDGIIKGLYSSERCSENVVEATGSNVISFSSASARIKEKALKHCGFDHRPDTEAEGS